MRRLAAILLALVASVAILIVGSGAGGDEGTYEVRAIFDNAAFMVPGEEVRIAGANVGVVSDVDVTGEDEPVHLDGSPEPGKAALVLRIDDAGFQDFLADASCLIRPQSLLGEKFVECQPTQPRAAGSPAPPPLEEVPEGQPGAGQRFLPIESNGKTVDLDLVNNIMREPYADRFRLILNDLGAGLAARGDELAEIVDRSDPALRETNEVLAILARQNQALARLATRRRRGAGAARPRSRPAHRLHQHRRDHRAGDRRARRRPRARPRAAAADSARAAGDHGRAEAVRRRRHAAVRGPGTAAPAATRATRALVPFAPAATTALTSLGDAAAASQQPLVDSDPVIKQVRGLAKSAAPAASNLAALLRSFDSKDGFRNLLRFVYRGVGAFNGFDNLGHFARAFLLITNCNDYVTAPQTGCIANFLPPTEETASAPAERPDRKQKRSGKPDPAPDGEGDSGRSDPGTTPPETPEAPTPAIRSIRA